MQRGMVTFKGWRKAHLVLAVSLLTENYKNCAFVSFLYNSNSTLQQVV